MPSELDQNVPKVLKGLCVRGPCRERPDQLVQKEVAAKRVLSLET